MSKPDITRLFFNGTIYTGNKALPFCESVVSRGSRILFTGELVNAKHYCNEQTELIDLEGAFMMPGFIDAHVHLVWGGQYLEGVDLSYVSGKDEFITLLRDYAKSAKHSWLLGGNWNHFQFIPVSMPNKGWIDAVVPDRPVLLHRMDYHIAVANSMALQLAGIDKDSIAPEGGEIEKDTDGNPTGILKDAAIQLVQKVIPAPTTSELEHYALRTIALANSCGITAVHDISQPEHIAIFTNLENSAELTCRVHCRLPITSIGELAGMGMHAGINPEFVSLGSVKAFADGSLGAGTAWMFEDFTDEPGNCGMPMEIMASGELAKLAMQADAAGLQLAIHAIGDRANTEVLHIAEMLSRVHGSRDRRFRIEHAQHLRAWDISRFVDNEVIASMQPLHLFEDGGWMSKRLGKKRSAQSYCFGSLMQAGAKVCFGSDFPIVTLSPLAGIQAAVTRQVKQAGHEYTVVANELLTLEQAIEAYTINAAYAAFQEDNMGSIMPGKFADFTVLSQNIFLVEYGKITEIDVLKTFVGGAEVYSAGSSSASKLK